MFKRLTLVAAMLSASPLCAAPMEILPSGHPVAIVSLGESPPLRFIIDTAASSTSVLPKLRAAMPDVGDAGDGQTISGAAGQTRIDTIRLKSLQVDGRRYEGLNAFALPASPVDALGVDGVLGADVIARHVIEMDMRQGEWRILDAVSEELIGGLHRPVPITLDEGLTPHLTITIDGKDVPAILDTGAKGSIMNWAAAGVLGLSPDTPGLVPAGTVQGVSVHGAPSVIASFSGINLGEADLTGTTVRIADLPVFEALGFAAGQPAMIVGIDMLADRRFVIDHPGKRLYVSRPDSQAPAG